MCAALVNILFFTAYPYVFCYLKRMIKPGRTPFCLLNITVYMLWWSLGEGPLRDRMQYSREYMTEMLTLLHCLMWIALWARGAVTQAQLEPSRPAQYHDKTGRNRHTHSRHHNPYLHPLDIAVLCPLVVYVVVGYYAIKIQQAKKRRQQITIFKALRRQHHILKARLAVWSYTTNHQQTQWLGGRQRGGGDPRETAFPNQHVFWHTHECVHGDNYAQTLQLNISKVYPRIQAVYNPPGDGICFWRAVSHALNPHLNTHYEKTRQAIMLKQAAIDYVIKKAKHGQEHTYLQRLCAEGGSTIQPNQFYKEL